MNEGENINLTIENEEINQSTFILGGEGKGKELPPGLLEFQRKYNELKEQLKYPKPSITVDNVIFSKDLHYILLIIRGNEPFKDYYALPGGFAESGESLEEASKRELKEETNITIPIMKLSGVYSKPDRDPRGWTISVAYYNTIDKKSYKAKAGDDAKGLEWIEMAKINQISLAFDHKQIIMDAYAKALDTKRI